MCSSTPGGGTRRCITFPLTHPPFSAHHRRFYEFLPNSGAVGWDVDPWGRWRITAASAEFEAEVEATCDAPGTPLRAPTIDQGLTPFCRDSFAGTVRALRCCLGGCGHLLRLATLFALH